MSYRVGTPNYNLPQTEGTDKRDWADTNQAFLLIDTAIKNAVDTSASASSAADSAQTAADEAGTTATHAQTDASAALTLATTANENATIAKNRADNAYSLANTADTNAKAGGIGQNSSVKVNGGASATLVTLLNSLYGNIDHSKVVLGRSYLHMHRSTEDRAFSVSQVATSRIDCACFMANTGLAVIISPTESAGQNWQANSSVIDYNPSMPSGSYFEFVY